MMQVSEIDCEACETDGDKRHKRHDGKMTRQVTLETVGREMMPKGENKEGTMTCWWC